MRRRRFLASLPVLTGVVGCVDGFDSSGPHSATSADPSETDTATAATRPSTQTRTATATPTESGTTAARTQSPGTPPPSRTVPATLRASFRHVVAVDGIRTIAPDRAQFAFVRPPPIEPSPPTDAFSLSLGDRTFDPVEIDTRYGARTPGVDTVYTEEGTELHDDARTGSLMFDVPAVETDTAALQYDGTRYPLAQSDRERLATAPEFELESVSTPDSPGPDEPIELGLTVSNEGTREGVYLAGFRISGLPRFVDLTVPPGETRSESVEYETSSWAGSMSFAFSYPGGRDTIEVNLEQTTETDSPTAR